MSRSQPKPTQDQDRFLTVAERLAKSRKESEAKAAVAAKISAAPKRRK